MSRPGVLIDHLPGVGIVPPGVYCRSLHPKNTQGRCLRTLAGDPTVTRWSEATEDISASRKLVADGPLSIARECRGLAVVSLSQATVASGRPGPVRLQKRRHGRSRDDVAVSGVLASGAAGARASAASAPALALPGRVVSALTGCGSRPRANKLAPERE